MAEEQPYTTSACATHGHEGGEDAGGEIKDRGIFDFLGKKKEEKPQEDVVIASEIEKFHVCEEPCEKKMEDEPYEKEKMEEEKEEKSGLLHRSASSSSSSSDEEEEGEGEGGERKKKKKKKGLKEMLNEEKKEEQEEKKVAEAEYTTTVPVVKYDDTHGEATDEKKGFLDKIKEKLPGGHPKKAEEVTAECGSTEVQTTHEVDSPKEKKGILEKIKEKLPGYHKSGGEETPNN